MPGTQRTLRAARDAKLLVKQWDAHPRMLVLGIETSCDETGLALYDSEAGLLAHELHSQVAMHEAYGGVVPELASRDHIRRILPLTRAVFARTGRSLADLGAIAYTEGPGLAGALLVGAAFAKALALALGIRSIGIHHLEGHLLSPLLAERAPQFPFAALLVSGGHTQLMRVDGVGSYALLGETLDDAAGEAFDKSAKLLGLGYPGGPALSRLAERAPQFAFVALLVSGGHTQLMRVDGVGRYALLGETLDDAAGEAFDKSAKLLGLGYPGGPELSHLATRGRAGRYSLPRPMLHSSDLDFSFSGLKTAVLTAVRATPPDEKARADLAHEFQAAMVEVLVAKSLAALEATGLGRLVVAGGVGANTQLRDAFDAKAARGGFSVFYPEPDLCTDNGAMIAHAGALRIARGEGTRASGFSMRPRWELA